MEKLNETDDELEIERELNGAAIILKTLCFGESKRPHPVSYLPSKLLQQSSCQTI